MSIGEPSPHGGMLVPRQGRCPDLRGGGEAVAVDDVAANAEASALVGVPVASSAAQQEGEVAQNKTAGNAGGEGVAAPLEASSVVGEVPGIHGAWRASARAPRA